MRTTILQAGGLSYQELAGRIQQYRQLHCQGHFPIDFSLKKRFSFFKSCKTVTHVANLNSVLFSAASASLDSVLAAVAAAASSTIAD
jgi:hypothetical protein